MPKLLERLLLIPVYYGRTKKSYFKNDEICEEWWNCYATLSTKSDGVLIEQKVIKQSFETGRPLHQFVINGTSTYCCGNISKCWTIEMNSLVDLLVATSLWLVRGALRTSEITPTASNWRECRSARAARGTDWREKCHL